MTRVVNYIKETANIYAGTDIQLPFAVFDDDLGTPAVLDITGWTLQYDQKDDEQAPDPTNTLQKTVGSGIAITTPAAGELLVTLDAADTSPAAFKTEHNHYWSLTRLTPAPILVLGEGRIYIKGTPFSA